MTPTITLTYTDERGERRRAAVRKSPFTIGRAPDSDLRLHAPNVSHRHARIEVIGGRHYLSDCDSSGGTALNRRRVTVAMELRDGDLIGIGNSLALYVRAGAEEEGAHGSRLPAPPPARAGAASLLNTPVVVGAGIGLSLLLAVALALLLINRGGQSDNLGRNEPPKTPPVLTPTPAPTPTATAPRPAPTDNAGAGGKQEAKEVLPGQGEDSGSGDEQLAGEVSRVMVRISDGGVPYISEAGLKDVERRVREYRGSTALAEQLRAVSGGGDEVKRLAGRINMKPALLAYAALAQSERGGNPVVIARQMTPKLLTLRATFGTESPNRSLLLVAAYLYPFNPPIGTQTRTPHPLDVKLRQSGGKGSKVNIAEAGSVWFLRRANGITDESYQLVVRLLAIGVIAQNPRRYGVEADPIPY